MLPALRASAVRAARTAARRPVRPSGCSPRFSSTAVAPAPPAVSSIDPAEVRKFAGLSAHWWNETRGPFAALHRLNTVRVPIVRRALTAGDAGPAPPRDTAALPLSGFTICDVGCGGGILSEALARLGAQVTGIDAAPANVAVAAAHASLDPRFGARLSYSCTTAEQLAVAGAQFDAVVASEVLEHVADAPSFVASLAALVKPDGRLVVTTLNRSARAFLAAILAAEYALGLVPPGTHEWAKFVTPQELASMCADAGLRLVETTGLSYNPVTGAWSPTADVSINYAAVARKPRLA